LQNSPRPARYGTRSTLAPTRASARNAARGTNASSRRCIAGRWKATSSSSIIICSSPISIKQQSEYAPDAGILPEVGAVIFDEAHELEDVAGSYFGVSVSNGRVEELCRDVEASLQRNHMLSVAISSAVKSLRERSMFFFALLPQGEGRFSFENRRDFLEENGEEFMSLQQSLTRLGSELENLPSKPEEVFNFARRAQELQVQFGFLMESEDHNTVFWIERRRGSRDRHNVYLQATPIDVAPILKTCLFDNWSAPC
jgi:ATP-dependent DNA helicase DinG